MRDYTETSWRDEPFRRALTPDPTWIDCGNGFERAVSFEPGFDSHTRNWGIAAMRMRFLLRGPLGATQFLMGAGWVPGRREVNDWYPSGWDLGYHALKPSYEGHESYDCDLLPGGHCYYDGSGLAADPVMDAFIAEGEPAVWRALHEFYDDRLAGEHE